MIEGKRGIGTEHKRNVKEYDVLRLWGFYERGGREGGLECWSVGVLEGIRPHDNFGVNEIDYCTRDFLNRNILT